MTTPDDPTIDIQCPCGEVTLRITGSPVVCFYCHCDDCQAVHGAAYLPAAIFRHPQVVVLSGRPLEWKRKRTIRGTCPRCGTRLYAEPPGLEIRSLPATLLPAQMFRPQFHVQCQHARLPVRDDLPHYLEWGPMLGGGDALAPW